MTAEIFRQIGTPRRGGIVAICDHASNHVPDDIHLGLAPERMEQHIAWDIGTAGICERLAFEHGIPAILAGFSRLVIDANREEDSPGLVPESSDGVLVPGNIGADREARLDRFYRPYHAEVARWLAEVEPALVLSIFWRRFTTAGAVTSMLVGTGGTLLLIWLSPTIQVDVLGRTDAWFPLTNPALLTIPLAFLSGIVVSLATRRVEGEEHYAGHERRMHLGTTGD